ncbi:MAG TPA: thioredoxin [Candidatus Limnocylindrales bacterium]|jgi:thioredoxin|nr:thioredoxin [Candidatus Limnocylindrales bacterium]
MGEPVAVDDPDAFEALTGQSALPVLVDFWAPWCGPCKMVTPELVKVASQLAGKLVIAKVNTEESPRLAQRFAISAIPTLVLFKAGKEIARQAGAMPAPAILQFIGQSHSL